MPRLEALMHALIEHLPWYDAPAIEARHEHSADVHRRSITARQQAEHEIARQPGLRDSRAYRELGRLDASRRSR